MTDPNLFKRYGDLVAVCQLFASTQWRYRCTRIKRDGTICQNTRDLERERAHLYNSCAECGKEAKKRFGGNRSVGFGYKKVIEKFSPEQMARYYEILRGREGAECERDAVELVCIEIRNQGACCKVCKEGRRGRVA